MKSRYAYVAEPGKVVLKEEQIRQPGVGEILLKAKYSTLSPGTEYKLVSGNFFLPLPQRIGYSMVAEIIEVGDGVRHYKLGDHVVSTAQHSDYQVIDARNTSPVPEGTDLEQAAFFNLAQTALYGIRRSKVQLGEPAVVMGQGLVGAITAQLAKISGAVPVIVTDLDNTRLEIAKSLGASIAINPLEEPDRLAQVVESLGWGGVPVVYEATGARQALVQAADLVSERGRIVMLSTNPGTEAPDITTPLMMKGASLIGGYVNSKPLSMQRSDLTIADSWPPSIAPGWTRYVNSDTWTSDEDIRAVLSHIKFGGLNFKPLISHRFSQDEIGSAYELVYKKDPSLLGGVICWD